MQAKIQTKLFFSHFAAIILVSGSVGTYFYESAIDSLVEALRSRLQNSAALVSQGLSVEGLDAVRTPDDRDGEVYRQGVDALRNFVTANPDIAFVYVMRRVGDRAAFVLDSDMDDPALPGEIYPHDVPELMQGFLRPSVDAEITRDRWGSFLSGYSPLDGGDGDYLIGIDMRADEVQSKLKEIRLAGLLSLSLSVILAALFSRFLSRNFTRRIGSVTGRLATIAPEPGDWASPTQGDELAQLSDALERMTTRLEKSRQQIEAHETELTKARDELEHRVDQRTAELVHANNQLREEIKERKRMERKLETISHTDYLTGILNRRAISRQLEGLVDEISDDEQCFSTILLDLDNFKAINDRYGHEVGDQTLKHAVERLRHGIRDSDLLGRWGGEEFLIVCPSTSLEEAEGLARRLCEGLSGGRVSAGEASIAVTGSFGVSRYVIGETLSSCLKRNDDALYAAKHQGRNCVVVMPPGAPA
jgi:diguanylate cyclase (GGDEF)-like protein